MENYKGMGITGRLFKHLLIIIALLLLLVVPFYCKSQGRGELDSIAKVTIDKNGDLISYKVTEGIISYQLENYTISSIGYKVDCIDQKVDVTTGKKGEKTVTTTYLIKTKRGFKPIFKDFKFTKK